MDIPILSIYDQIHQQLDELDALWPLKKTTPLHWIQEFHQMIFEEWAALEKRLQDWEQRLTQEDQFHSWTISQLFQKAKGYFILCMYEECQSCLQKALHDLPHSDILRTFLAATYYEQKKYDAAAKELSLIINTSSYPPIHTYANHLMGCIEAQNGHWHKALNIFQDVFDTDHSLEESLWNQALCFCHLQQYDEALHLVHNLSALHPEEPSHITCLRRYLEHMATLRE